MIIASALGWCRAVTVRVTMSEYGAQTQPPALPARTAPTASSHGDWAVTTMAAPSAPQTPPTVVGARGPRRAVRGPASSRPAR